MEQLKWESLKQRQKGSGLILFYKGLKGQANIPVDDLKTLLGILETIIQNHFKSHMLGLMLIGIVSFLKLLEIGMHSLHLLYPLLNVLRFASLDSHHWWDLENSPLIRWPWWMYVSWCVTSKLFWFWFWYGYLIGIDTFKENKPDVKEFIFLLLW